MFSSKNCSQLFLTLLHIAVRKLQNKLSWDYYWKQSSFWVATIQSDSQSSLWKTLTEAAIQRCSQTKAFLKYAVNLQENTHAKVAEQLYWNHTLASGSTPVKKKLPRILQSSLKCLKACNLYCSHIFHSKSNVSF